MTTASRLCRTSSGHCVCTPTWTTNEGMANQVSTFTRPGDEMGRSPHRVMTGMMVRVSQCSAVAEVGQCRDGPPSSPIADSLLLSSFPCASWRRQSGGLSWPAPYADDPNGGWPIVAHGRWWSCHSVRLRIGKRLTTQGRHRRLPVCLTRHATMPMHLRR